LYAIHFQPDKSFLLKTSIMEKEKEIKNPWTILSSEEKYDNKWINLTEYQVINPGGGRGIYGKVHFKNTAIGVVPVDDALNTWLVGQFRFTLNEWTWEIPEGGGPSDQSPLEAAKRELKEETGLTAARWKQIVKLHTSNSVTDEVGYIFLAQDISHGESTPEETEADMKVWRLPLKDAVKMVEEQKITDGLSIMGLLMVARMMGI
jgi:8-oxo-dGTP pyrophosphatase MutT (NUDIX family)